MTTHTHTLQLERPLAVFDIESTGTSPRADRIVEIAIAKLLPGGEIEMRTFLLNPGIPIPEEVSRIHGITDADVADCPSFPERAAEIAGMLDGTDLGGYNVLRFDIPMLLEEFRRAGIEFDPESSHVVDAQRIFHRREPRDLSAALQFYCGEEHVDAHGAEADALATVRVLEGEFRKYPDLPRSVPELDEYCNPRNPDWVDRAGKLKWRNGEVVLNFGQRKGTALKMLIEQDPRYIRWMLASDFPRDVREIVQNAMGGKWPKRDE